MEETSKDYKVIISSPTYRFDNQKADNTVNELTNMIINLDVPIVHNKNISRKRLGCQDLHLNSYRSFRLVLILIYAVGCLRGCVGVDATTFEY